MLSMGRSRANCESDMSGILDAILEVGRQRKMLLDQMRSALESGDGEKALVFARRLCGVDNEKSARIN